MRITLTALFAALMTCATFAPAAHAWTYGFKTVGRLGTGSAPAYVHVKDLSGDGKADLVVANHDGNTISVFKGVGDGSFQPRVDYPAGTGPVFVTSADFDKDGKTDIAVANKGAAQVWVYWGNGDATFSNYFAILVGTSPVSVVAMDADGAGGTDLAVANLDSNTVSVILGDGTRAFPTRHDIDTAARPSSIVAGDFDRKGKADLAVACQGSDVVSILANSGAGVFTPVGRYTIGDNPVSVATGDFDKDSFPDIVTANNLSNSVTVLLANPDGTFKPGVTYPVGVGPRQVIAVDIDGDGKLDIATANFSSDTVSVLYGNSDGTFNPKVDYVVGNGPSSLAAGDFDRDGLTDLAVVNTLDDTVSALLGRDQPFHLTVTVNNAAGGAVNPTGGDFTAGTLVTVTATPKVGFSFTGWTGDLTGRKNPMDVLMKNDLSIMANFTTGPFISAVTPDHGVEGTLVTLTGTRFGSATGSIMLEGRKLKAAPQWSDTSVRFVTPSGVPYGPHEVSVTTRGRLTSSTMTYTIMRANITGSSAMTASPGDHLTLTGAWFGVRGTVNIFRTGAAPRRVKASPYTGNSITFTVPSLPPGAYGITVTNSHGTSLPWPLTIAAP